MSERLKSFLALLAGLGAATGGILIAVQSWELVKTPQIVGGLMLSCSGVVLTWVVRGYQALAEEAERRDVTMRSITDEKRELHK